MRAAVAEEQAARQRERQRAAENLERRLKQAEEVGRRRDASLLTAAQEAQGALKQSRELFAQCLAEVGGRAGMGM